MRRFLALTLYLFSFEADGEEEQVRWECLSSQPLNEERTRSVEEDQWITPSVTGVNSGGRSLSSRRVNRERVSKMRIDRRASYSSAMTEGGKVLFISFSLRLNFLFPSLR